VSVRASAGFMDSLGALCAATGARLMGDDGPFAGLSTDTRTLKPGDLFVALSGPNFDGHDFVRRAACLGAAGALVGRQISCALPQAVVGDPLAGLQRYAAHWRGRLNGPLIGVTGSNGKTTVKEMLRAIFAARGEVLATRGNLNNHIGVPLTLLGLRATHRSAVVEMGANHAGEIARLAAIARPTAGVVTMAGPAHLEGFGSVEGVAHAKGELFAALPADGVAAINADDAFAALWEDLAGHCRRVRFALDARAEIGAEAVEAGALGTRFRLRTPGGPAEVELAFSGRHNLVNALAAAAVAWGCGLSPAQIARGLGQAQPVGGRLRRVPGVFGSQVVDDTYNANPSSVRAALEWLVGQPGQSWAVLGDMAELGAEASRLHADCGRWARDLGVARLFTVGPLSRATAQAYGAGACHADTLEELVAALHGALAHGGQPTILVKGSRSAGMERVVSALAAAEDAGTPAPDGES